MQKVVAMDDTLKLLLEGIRSDIGHVRKDVRSDIKDVNGTVSEISKTITGVEIDVRNIKETTARQESSITDLKENKGNTLAKLGDLDDSVARLWVDHELNKSVCGVFPKKRSSTPAPPSKANGFKGSLIKFAPYIMGIIFGIAIGASIIGFMLGRGTINTEELKPLLRELAAQANQ